MYQTSPYSSYPYQNYYPQPHSSGYGCAGCNQNGYNYGYQYTGYNGGCNGCQGGYYPQHNYYNQNQH